MTDFISIVGPTASGKTRLAAQLAHSLEGEVVSADSRQVYRRMDIGTGKDLDDYRVGEQVVPHHLIDIAEPGERYNLFRFQTDFLDVFRRLQERQKACVVCGGSGLYVESLVRGYQISEVPENPQLRAELSTLSIEQLTARLSDLKAQMGEQLHNHTDLDSPQRAVRAIEIEEYRLKHDAPRRHFPQLRSLVFGLQLPREQRRERISQRLEQRLREGMVEEVKSLLDEGLSPEALIYYGLEYKFVTLFLTQRMSYDEMHDALETAIHQFAKRQMTWFRGMERRGTPIRWIDAQQSTAEQLAQVLAIVRAERAV